MNVKHCLVTLLFATTPAVGATYVVGMGDDCDSFTSGGCFTPSTLTIHVGDTVEFYSYVDVLPTPPHNVVADDGSFRCAVGCDGEGGSGTPVSVISCFLTNTCSPNPPCGTKGCDDSYSNMHFTRKFDAPGIVKYHDEVTLAAGVINVTPLPMSPGFTGSWFDPKQNGHGFALQVIAGEPMQLFASWLAFAPQGGQAWIVGLGPINGNRAVLRGFRTVGGGGRFPPNFEAANVVEDDWGTLTFTFSDCDHGHVDWAPTVAEYTSGGMDLTRLTLPAGLSCP